MRFERNAEGARWKCPRSWRQNALLAKRPPNHDVILFSQGPTASRFRIQESARCGRRGDQKKLASESHARRPITSRSGPKSENGARKMSWVQRARAHSVFRLIFVRVTHAPKVVFGVHRSAARAFFFDAVKTRRVPLRTPDAGDPDVAGHKLASAPGTFAPPRAFFARTRAPSSRRTPTRSPPRNAADEPDEQNNRCSSFFFIFQTSRPRRPDDPTRWSRCAPEITPRARRVAAVFPSRSPS